MRKCVLVFARQAAMRADVARAITPFGYGVELASSEKTARQLMGKKRFVAAVLDASAGAADDLAFVHELQNTIGKLVLLAKDARAGEQLTKSFPDALVCPSQRLEHEKLRAFLEGRTPTTAAAPDAGSEPEFLHFAGRTLDVAGSVLLDANRQEVALSRGEFALLVAFARNPGRVLSRVHLRNAIGGAGSAEAYDRSIDMLVARLRRKIEANPAKPQFIITVPGAGYRFAAQVRKSESTSSPSTVPPTTVRAERVVRPAERRQLTVLSCQILGFAALAAKLDPEDLDQSISPVYAACAEVIARFGGMIAGTLGDGVLAYFGYPTAHESDAESAVRAALELVRVIGRIEAGPSGKFRARVGIATGLMVVGELRSVRTIEPAAMGEALNLALHMQNAAPANSVVIAASTRDLIGRFFQCREIEPVVVEEGGRLVPAWRVVEENAGLPRFEALRRDGMLELVGREGEIERLSQCWSKARNGHGQVVLLTGEAGIGKSRLVIELQERLCFEPRATLRYYGFPHRADAPMSVLIDELQRTAGFAPDDVVPQKVEKLQREFAALGSAATEATALGCTLLGLPYESPPAIAQLAPHKRKERTLAALLARVEAMAFRQPVFAVVEDIHWVDPTSLEFVTLLVERASAMRLLLVIVARPEFAPPWPEHSYVTALALPRLNQSDSAALIAQVAGERRVLESIQAEIIARADGVPLFVEELTKAILESSATGCGGALRPRSAGAAPIPATLHGLLLARFDRLGRGKSAAQAGAVIGREFSLALVRAITGMDEPTLLGALDQLLASGLVLRRGSPPEATFIFKHALVRDAAYGMLSRDRRQTLHASVARAYEENLPETAQVQPELLAYHWREGGEPIKAVSYLLTAAERALYRSATTEALSHLAQARKLISNQPANKQRLQLELTLELTSARALLATRGYTAVETREAYRRARERCEALSDQSSLPLIMHGQWLGAWMTGDHQSALERARELYAWGERNCDTVGVAMAHADLGMTLTTLGRLVEARGHLDEALRINSFALPGRQPFVASDVDGRISALSFMHNCLLLLGLPDQAQAVAKEAASLKPQNLYSQALAQTRTLRMGIFECNAPAVADAGAAVIRLCQEQKYPHLISTAMVYSGWAMAQCDDPANGTALCKRGLVQLQSLGAGCWLPLHLALLAECYEQAGDRQRAAATVTKALESVEATGERIWESEIHRLEGKLLLGAGGDAGAAEVCFIEALCKARRQNAKLLELRAAVSLADLLKRKRRPTQAREVLAPVYASFTEGFDFIDLREAKTLLDTLAEGNRSQVAKRSS